MKYLFQSLCLVTLLSLVFMPTQVCAQVPESPQTETGEPDFDRPLDDIVENRLIQERMVLPYEPVREADIFWKKKVWRVIDVREKMNHHFTYPVNPLITIMMDAAMNGDIKTYVDDEWSGELSPSEVATKAASTDTISTFDPETYEEQIQVVVNDLNPDDIKRFRMKEIWFFDEESAQMKVRIIGMAPLKDITDDNGNFLYEEPLLWIYYPDCREFFARETAYMVNNDASPISWEDIFEMRYFSSYIYKQSNVRDRRLKDYLSGIDLLIEADRIKNEIFNYEQDLWSY